MVVKTKFTENDFVKILSDYSLGDYKSSQPIKEGTIQTNYILRTKKGKFVFRYYDCRSKKSILFESNLINYLKNHNYPCPTAFKNVHGEFVGMYKKKPFIIFEFMEGKHVKQPTLKQRKELIKEVAQLHNLTRNYRPKNKEHRLNYNIPTCRKLARAEAKKINTKNAKEKLKWHGNQLDNLELPKSLSRGICHADFHFSNVLFEGNRFSSLLDFDDANHTFLMFDLVGLIEYRAWYHKKDKLDFKRAREVVKEYIKYRKLNNNEKRHLFDVYKLSILLDCIWYFKRGDVKDFYEKRKIDFLDSIGRDEFYKKIF